MKIRSLHKIEPGFYKSNDGQWLFKEDCNNRLKRNNPEKRQWHVYRRMRDGKFYIDNPYFFESYPTLKSLIKALEKAKP